MQSATSSEGNPATCVGETVDGCNTYFYFIQFLSDCFFEKDKSVNGSSISAGQVSPSLALPTLDPDLLYGTVQRTRYDF